eukprot:Sspe_Gene.15477::Locus_5388_Transcript_1_4_Confidence_0.400_Length_1381::g.15477::m.15477
MVSGDISSRVDNVALGVRVFTCLLCLKAVAEICDQPAQAFDEPLLVCTLRVVAVQAARHWNEILLVMLTVLMLGTLVRLKAIRKEIQRVGMALLASGRHPTAGQPETGVSSPTGVPTINEATTVDEIERVASALREQKKHVEAAAYTGSAVSKFPADSRVLALTARALCDLSGTKNDPAEQKNLLLQGLQHAEGAAQSNPSLFLAWKVLALIEGKLSSHKSFKDKIAGSMKIKEYAEKALELKEDDGTCHHILGSWHYHVAKLTWVEKRVVVTVLGRTPEASYETAMQHLQRADEIESFADNSILLGECCLAVGKRDEARTWFQRALEDSEATVTAREKALKGLNSC